MLNIFVINIPIIFGWTKVSYFFKTFIIIVDGLMTSDQENFQDKKFPFEGVRIIGWTLQFFRVTSFHNQLFSFRKGIIMAEKLSFSYSGDILILLWYCLTGWCHPKSRPSRTQWHSSCSPIAQDKTSFKIDHKCLENLPMNFVDKFFSFLVNWFSIYNRSD